MSICEATWMYIKRGFNVLLLSHELLEKYCRVSPILLLLSRDATLLSAWFYIAAK